MTELDGDERAELERLRAQAARGGPGPVPFTAALAAHRVAVEVGLVIAAAGALVLWRHPGVAGTLWTSVVLAVLVVAVELVGRIGARARAGTIGEIQRGPNAENSLIAKRPYSPPVIQGEDHEQSVRHRVQ